MFDIKSKVKSLVNKDYKDIYSDEDKRKKLVEKIKKMEEKILSFPKGSIDRKKLGLEKIKIQTEIHKIRPKVESMVSIQNCFVDIAKALAKKKVEGNKT